MVFFHFVIILSSLNIYKHANLILFFRTLVFDVVFNLILTTESTMNDVRIRLLFFLLLCDLFLQSILLQSHFLILWRLYFESEHKIITTVVFVILYCKNKPVWPIFVDIDFISLRIEGFDIGWCEFLGNDHHSFIYLIRGNNENMKTRIQTDPKKWS